MAVLQTAPAPGATAENLREIEVLTAAAAGADLVVTCELSVSGYVFRPDELPAPVAPDDHKLQRLLDLAPAVSVGIVENSPTGMPYNSAVLLRKGEAASVQRKLHPVSYAPWNEHHLFSPGDGLTSANVNGVTVATLICNDAWHPVMPWLTAQAGAEVLLIPTASIGNGPNNESAQSWELILTHTARILQCFVVFANRVGEQDGHEFWGGSRIIDPNGQELARADGSAGAIHADLDIAALRQLRRDVPLLKESRHRLVAEALATLERENNV